MIKVANVIYVEATTPDALQATLRNGPKNGKLAITNATPEIMNYLKENWSSIFFDFTCEELFLIGQGFPGGFDPRTIASALALGTASLKTPLIQRVAMALDSTTFVKLRED